MVESGTLDDAYFDFLKLFVMVIFSTNESRWNRLPASTINSIRLG